MESSSGLDSKSSSLRRQGVTVDMQTAADTMVAVTESFRQHYHDQQANGPRRPQPAYSHSRSSSGSSVSSARLLDDVAAPPMRTSTETRASRIRQDNDDVPDALVPGPRGGRESQSLLPRNSNHFPPREGFGITIRLATPDLPPRLDTPHTPPKRYSSPAVISPESDSEPYVVNSNALPASYAPTRQNSIVQAAKHFDPFKSNRHTYTALRPDCGTESRPFGTVTHIRAESDSDPLASKEFRRKPLAPGARRVTFNHSVTNEMLFVGVICLSQVVIFAAFSQALVPARAIGDSLESNTESHRAWYTAAYTLTAGTFVMLGGRLGGIFGNKTIFVIGYIWMSIWSLLAGLSTYVSSGKAPYFCFCRAMQGVGAALLLPNGTAMIRSAYPPGSRKTLIMGLFNASAPVGLVLGAVMASLFAEWTSFVSWPWAFYSLSTVSVALAALSAVIIPGKDVQMHNLDGNMFVRLNGCGVILSITGLVLFSIGWNQAPVVSFDTTDTYVLIVIGALLFTGYALLESKTTHPLVPFKKVQATAGIILLYNAGTWAAFGVWMWYLVQFFEVSRRWSALDLSAGFVPLLVGGVAASQLDAFLLAKKCRPHVVMMIASLSICASSILMATAPVKQTFWLNSFVSILVMGFGVVLANPAAVTLLNDSVPEGHQGLALGLVGTVTSYAISVGLGMAGGIEVHVRDDGGDALAGFRAAQYFGIGLGGMSVLLASALLIVSYVRR